MGWAANAWSDDAWFGTAWFEAGEALAVAPAGGFMMDFERFRERRDDDEKKRRQALETIKALKDATEREIGELLQQDIADDTRKEEITELQRLIAKNATDRDFIAAKAHNARIAKVFVRAALQKNFSAVEALEREMDRKIEEDDFLMLALVILD